MMRSVMVAIAVATVLSVGFILGPSRSEAAQGLTGQERAEAAGRGLVGSLAPDARTTICC